MARHSKMRHSRMLRSALFRWSLKNVCRTLRMHRTDGWVYDAAMGRSSIRPGVIYLFVSISLFVFFLTIPKSHPSHVYAQTSHAPVSFDRTQFVGDKACLPCHQRESESYSHTSHHLTSQN